MRCLSYIFPSRRRKLAEDALGILVQFGWNLNSEVNVEIAAATLAHMGNALFADSQDGAVGATRRNSDNFVFFQRRDGDGATEDGLGEGDGGLVMEIVTVALKAIVIFN